MSTQSLDQMSRTGAFHHLSRRKVTIADTHLHSYVTSDFDQGCGRLHGLIRTCMPVSLAFNAAVCFK